MSTYLNIQHVEAIFVTPSYSSFYCKIKGIAEPEPLLFLFCIIVYIHQRVHSFNQYIVFYRPSNTLDALYVSRPFLQHTLTSSFFGIQQLFILSLYTSKKFRNQYHCFMFNISHFIIISCIKLSSNLKQIYQSVKLNNYIFDRTRSRERKSF